MKNIFLTFAFASAISFMALAGVTSNENLGASQSSEITFDKGLASLSDTAKAEIKQAVESAKAMGPIKQIKLVAWSDHEYPAAGEKPSKESVKLAAARSEALRRYLKDELKVGHIKAYNMAARPNALQELFKTSQAELKDNMEKTGAAPTTGESTGLFGMNAKTSAALVLIYTKGHPNKI